MKEKISIILRFGVTVSGFIWLLGIASILLSGCTGVSTTDLDAFQQAINTQYPSSTPAASPTATITPSPTLDYQSTLVIAQATADEARRLNTQATAEYEQRLQVQMQATAEIERQAFEMRMLTATMAGISIPLTQTQQSVINTQIPAQQTLMAGLLTATHEAPGQVIAMRDAELAAYYAPVKIFVIVVTAICFSLFLLAAAHAMYMNDQRKRERDAHEAQFIPPVQFIQSIPDSTPQVYNAQPETVVTLRTDHGGGFGRTEKMVIPCRPDQFTELCEGVISGVRSLAINVWEGAQEPFTRGEFMRVREWMQRYQFAQSAGAGSMILTAEGETLFRAWMESHSLPGTFKFEEVGE